MLSFNIAKRFLSANKLQTFLIVLGISVGVSVQIFIGALIFGLQDSLIETTVGSTPHVTISTKEKGTLIDDYKEIEISNDRIKTRLNVFDQNVFLRTDENSFPVLLRGFETEDFSEIYQFDKKLIEGELPLDGEVIIGAKIAKEANLNIGDEYKFASPEFTVKSLKISGIFDFNVESINNLWAITNINTAQKLYLNEDVVSSIEFQVNDVFEADSVAKSIDTDYEVDNWKESNGELLAGLNGQSVSSLMIQVFVMISVLLGIASVLIISVVQKRKQLGILKAMGITDNDSFKIFIFQGFLIGILGGIGGVLLGLGLLFAFQTFALNPDGTPVVETTIKLSFIALSFVVAVIASTVASFIPSISSKKLSPMEVIKNG